MKCYVVDLDTRYWEDVVWIFNDESPASPSSVDRGAEVGDELLSLIPFDIPSTVVNDIEPNVQSRLLVTPCVPQSNTVWVDAALAMELDEYLRPEDIDWVSLGEDLESILKPVESSGAGNSCPVDPVNSIGDAARGVTSGAGGAAAPPVSQRFGVFCPRSAPTSFETGCGYARPLAPQHPSLAHLPPHRSKVKRVKHST